MVAALASLAVYGKSFTFLLPVALVGLAVLFFRQRRTFMLMLAFFLPYGLFLLNVGLFAPDHLLPTFVPVALCASCGIAALAGAWTPAEKRVWCVAAAALILHGAAAYLLFVAPEQRDARELARVMGRLARLYEPGAVMIADYGFGMGYWYLHHPKRRTSSS
jgi:4-amino-4-deoxy-L-arabinose transferase-like glycosyltransferase